ncbi:MAG: anion permease [Bacteroidales bacterium]
MDPIYYLIVGFLFILAITDLIVGVGNDAVNFLNSAVGSKVASFRVIIGVAFLGLLVGTLFSSGMMEIARSGIFNPGMFYFHQVMYIFLAVMITDVILLDAFNSLGLPTSTTVSIIFELLGASVSIATFKVLSEKGQWASISEYINSSKVLAIVSGILLSVVVAFTVGSIVQYFSRILFTFRYRDKVRYLGGLWGGLSFTAIIYFLVLKGARGATFMDEATLKYFEQNTSVIMLYSFIGFSIIFQLLIWLFRIDVLKFIVLAGTFALAMAFAGNDLVNFIGAPLAGFEAFKIYLSSGKDVHTLTMEGLAGAIKSPWYMLFGAGIVMGLTLVFSRKTRTVINTSVDLSRQDEGIEKFSSNAFSRALVRFFVNAGEVIEMILPASLRRFLSSRFTPPPQEEIEEARKKGISFDLIRASVNLVVASILIAFGTSHKLPLSTTYVTFMVAMGTSFADGAWGRESAVYRVAGVMTVIGGWFFTAFIAFTVSFIMGTIIFYGEIYAIIALLILASYLLYRQQRSYVRREKEYQTAKDLVESATSLSLEAIVTRCSNDILQSLDQTFSLYKRTLNALFKEDRKKLKKLFEEVNEFNKHSKLLKNNVHNVVDHLKEDALDAGHYYVQVVDFLREIAHCVSYIAEPVLQHVENNHKGMNAAQKAELQRICDDFEKLVQVIKLSIETGDFGKRDEVVALQQKMIEDVEKSRKAQVKRIKAHETGTKNSILFLNLLAESKNLANFVTNLYKSQRDFILASQNRLSS